MDKMIFILPAVFLMGVAPQVFAEVKSQTNDNITQCCPTCMTPQAVQCRSSQAQHRAQAELDVTPKATKAQKAGTANQ